GTVLRLGHPSMRRPWAGLSKKRKKSAGAEGVPQPGAGIGPLLPGLVDRQPQGSGDRLVAQPGEVTELHYLGGNRVFPGELRERRVQGGETAVGVGGWWVGQLAPPPPAAVAESLLATGVLDEDTAHRLGRRGEEVAPAVPVVVRALADQPQVSLMNQGRS